MEEKHLGPEPLHQSTEHDQTQLQPSADVSAALSSVQSEVARLKSRSMLDRLDIPRIAEQKLETIQELIIELTEIAAKITFEHYRKDQKSYFELAERCKIIMSQIEVQLITFTATIDIDYPRTGFLEKFAIVLIALFRNSISESNLLHTLGSRPAKRKALLAAAEQFREHLKYQNEQLQGAQRMITEHIQKPILQRVNQLLGNDTVYKKLLAQEIDVHADLERLKPTQSIGGNVLKDLYAKYVSQTIPLFRHTGLSRNSFTEMMYDQTKSGIEAFLLIITETKRIHEKRAYDQAEKDLSSPADQ